MWPHQLNLKPVAVARFKPRWTRIQQQAHACASLSEMAREWRYSGTTAHAHWHCGTLVNDNPGPGPARGPPSGDSLRPHTAAVYRPQCTHGGLGWALRGWYPSSNCAEPQPPGRTPALLKLCFIVLFQGSSTITSPKWGLARSRLRPRVLGLASCSREFPRLRARNAPTWPSEAQGTKPWVLYTL
jgi:hypothetical protein